MRLMMNGLLILTFALAPAIAAEPNDPATHAEAIKLIDAALKKYRAASSYKDALAAQLTVKATDVEGADVGHEEQLNATTRYAKPNRVAVRTDEFAIVSNGEKLWLHNAALDEYVERDAPEKLDLTKLSQDLMAGDPMHPVLYVMTHPDKDFAALFPMVQEFTKVTREELDGKPGHRIEGTFDATDTPMGPKAGVVPFSLWFDEKTGLLRQVRVDMTDMLRKALGLDNIPEGVKLPPGMPTSIEMAQTTLNLLEPEVGVNIPATEFAFEPEAGTEKVDQFTDPRTMEVSDPTTLLGKPAPEIDAKMLDGKQFKLGKQRGTVVVLDFWATWCGPCIQAMPGIQKVHKHYAGKKVKVIGISQDNPRMAKKVKKFVEDKKLSFPQIHDDKGKIGPAYKIASIPCTIIIGPKGYVQAVHIGFQGSTDDLAKELQGEIDKLLKGENLTEIKGESN